MSTSDRNPFNTKGVQQGTDSSPLKNIIIRETK